MSGAGTLSGGYIYDRGVISGVTLTASATVMVQSGATLLGVTDTSGSITIASGTETSAVLTGAGAYQTVYATATSTTVEAGASSTVASGGVRRRRHGHDRDQRRNDPERRPRQRDRRELAHSPAEMNRM